MPQILTVACVRFNGEAGPLPVADIDAVLLCIDDLSKVTDSLEQIRKTMKNVIWGIQLGNLSNKEAERLEKMGCDFIVLKLDSPSSALVYDQKLGKIMEINPTIDDTLVRTINMLSIDAVIVTDETDTKEITVERLMMYRRITAMVQKPVLLSLPVSLAKEHLDVLNDIGINGLLLDWSGKTTDKKISEIIKAISALPKSGKKKAGKERPYAVLPNLPSVSPDEDNDFEP